MADKYVFWCHSTILKSLFSRKYLSYDFAGEFDTGIPEAIVRNGLGTTIWQDGDHRDRSTSNWFHSAIPTTTQLVDRAIDVWDAYPRSKIDGQATLDSIHTCMGGTQNNRRFFKEAGLSLSTHPLEEHFNIPNQRYTWPLVMCLKVFLEDHGEVVLAGAGAKSTGLNTVNNPLAFPAEELCQFTIH